MAIMISKIEKFMRTYIRDMLLSSSVNEDENGYWCGWYCDGIIKTVESVKKIYTLYVSDDENIRDSIIPKTDDEYIYFALYYMIDKNQYFGIDKVFPDGKNIYERIVDYLNEAINLGCENAKYICARFKFYTKVKFGTTCADDKTLTKEEYIEFLKHGIKKEQNMYAMEFLGDIYLIKDDERAKKYYRKAMIHGCLYSMYSYGQIDIYKSNYSESVKYLKNAVKDGNFQASLQLGFKYRRNFIIAEHYFLKAVKHRDTNAMKELGDLYLDMKRYDEGIRILKLAIEKGESFAHETIGKIYYKLKDYKKAKKHFKIVIKSKYGFCEASYYIAKCYKKEGKYEKMIKQYVKVYLKDDTPCSDVCPNILEDIINYYVENDKVHKAVSVIVRREIGPDDEIDYKLVKNFMNNISKYKYAIEYMVKYGIYNLFDTIDNLSKYFVTEYPIDELKQILKSRKERGKVIRWSLHEPQLIEMIRDSC